MWRKHSCVHEEPSVCALFGSLSYLDVGGLLFENKVRLHPVKHAADAVPAQHRVDYLIRQQRASGDTVFQMGVCVLVQHHAKCVPRLTLRVAVATNMFYLIFLQHHLSFCLGVKAGLSPEEVPPPPFDAAKQLLAGAALATRRYHLGYHVYQECKRACLGARKVLYNEVSWCP